MTVPFPSIDDLNASFDPRIAPAHRGAGCSRRPGSGTRRDVRRFLDEHALPRNPLYEIGFAQIGCAPCTRPVVAGEHERAGRWDGAAKVECGLHAHPATAGPSTA